MSISQESEDINAPLSPTALSLHYVVQILARSGAQRATQERVEADIRAGAPVNPDGTVNMLHYSAWLAREVAHGN